MANKPKGKGGPGGHEEVYLEYNFWTHPVTISHFYLSQVNSSNSISYLKVSISKNHAQFLLSQGTLNQHGSTYYSITMAATTTAKQMRLLVQSIS